ncbi:MAG TPA: class I SAM-dependent methyltransferase [Actinophytocola sp.]|jgi:SAM-dependent methyltransferase|nr:class I SAM-dependent methyltransferase [Actinophytocola sp.]
MTGTRWTDRLGRLGGAVYDAGVEREWLARPAGRLLWGTDTRLLYAAIRAIGDLPDGAAVLDVPCGGGVALRGVVPGLRYVGADISPGMLARARRESVRCGVEVELIAADAARLPFAGGEFDLCVSFNGLHCLPDPAAAVREMARCVRPGGRVVGCTLVRGAGVRQDLAFGALRRAGLFGPGGTVVDVEHWLTGAGLRVAEMPCSGALAYFTAQR